MSSVFGVLIAAVLAVAPVAAQEGEGAPPPRGFSAEVRAVVDKILEVHPRRAELRADPGFQALAGALISDADRLDPPHAVVRMLALLERVGDAHTVLIPYTLRSEPFRARLPVELRRFEDGYYVTGAAPEAMPLLGARVTAVAGVPVEEIVRRVAAVLPKDNPAWAARWAALVLTMPGLLQGLDVAAGPASAAIEITGETPAGDAVRVELSPTSSPAAGLTALPRELTDPERWAEAEGTSNYVRTLEEGRTLYVALAEMGDAGSRTFDELDRLWREAMARPRLERMIIDLRENGGGDNMLPEPMRRRIVRSRFNRPGRLYALIGPVTFSAAQNFATRMERETDVLFVGEPTGGRPNHLGDPEVLEGPATGGVYLVSTLRWQDSTPFDERIWILPDLAATPTFADHLAGRDAALETALYQPPDLPEDPARWVRPWERASQMVGWRFFWQPDGS